MEHLQPNNEVEYDSTEFPPTEPNSPGTEAAIEAKYGGKHPDSLHDILRIIPIDYQAQMAFHELALMREDLNEHHAQFIVIDKQKRAPGNQGYDSGPSEEVNDSSVGSKDELIYPGYFRLNFDCQPLLAYSTQYSIGRGITKIQPDHNVDILLAAPDSKYRGRLAAAHAFLQLHLDSGAWLLRAGLGHHSTDDPTPEVIDHPNGFQDCKHGPVVYDGESIRHGAVRCLCKPRSSLVVGGMHFVIQFCIDTAPKDAKYLEDRTPWLQARGLPNPTTRQSGIPFESDIKTKWAVFREGLGAGAFGLVFEGLDPESGDLRAIKKLPIKSLEQRDEAETEIRVGKTLNNYPGLVKTYGWCNQQGESILKNRYPHELYIFQERGTSFRQYNWKSEPIIQWIDRRRLCRQLLEGLFQIHRRGWMHRDITPANVLLFQHPLRATLCDYGKLCQQDTDNVTTLAAWAHLPPEIRKPPETPHTYDRKIDIWLLGLTLLYCWFPRKWMQGKAELRDEAHYDKVMPLLMDPMKSLWQEDNGAFLRDPGAPKFVSLIRQMVSWDPADRPSTLEALNHESMQIDENAESAGLKRSRQSVSSTQD